jgi:hypothetical protein
VDNFSLRFHPKDNLNRYLEKFQIGNFFKKTFVVPSIGNKHVICGRFCQSKDS